MNTAQQGSERLRKTLDGILPSSSSLPYDEDAEVVNALTQMEFADLASFEASEGTSHQWYRARIRYLAALWPEASLPDLTQRIHGLINNKQFDLDDLRMVLQGRKLSDPSARTNELPITVIQGIGKCLRDGLALRATAREMRVAYDTVAAIEEFLGIRAANRSKQIDIAVEAAREGASVRTLARRLNTSTGRAHRLLSEGRAVLIELGELTKEGATV